MSFVNSPRKCTLCKRALVHNPENHIMHRGKGVCVWCAADIKESWATWAAAQRKNDEPRKTFATERPR